MTTTIKLPHSLSYGSGLKEQKQDVKPKPSSERLKKQRERKPNLYVSKHSHLTGTNNAIYNHDYFHLHID